MKETSIATLSQYIEVIEKLKAHYPPAVLINNPIADPFLYRGLSNVEYKLLPSVFREDKEPFVDYPITNKKYLSWTNEKGLLEAFIHEASGYLNIPPNDLLQWAEYAQHYGAPTRFLDWSRNPLVALYFACKEGKNYDGSVWVLHGANYRRLLDHVNQEKGSRKVEDIISELLNNGTGADIPLLYTPYYVDARMSAQQSYFLVWGTKQDPLEDMIQEDLHMDIPTEATGTYTFGQKQRSDILFRIVIPSKKKQPLLHELDMVGINEKSMFPGLDGIGRYIERKYRFDYIETIEHPYN